MLDINGKKIKRGQTVRYAGQLHKVLFSACGKIVLKNDDKKQLLTVPFESIGERIINISVISNG